jgi:hypothetical protein
VREHVEALTVAAALARKGAEVPARPAPERG